MRRPTITAIGLLCNLITWSQSSLPVPPAGPMSSTDLLRLDLSTGTASTGALLRGDVALGGRPSPGTRLSVEVRLSSGSQDKSPVVSAQRRIFPVKDSSFTFSFPLSIVKRWSAETPVLYEVQLRITDSAGRSSPVIARSIGFRKYSLSGDTLYVNTKPVRLNAVSIPSKLQLPRETIARNISLMKQFNINAILFTGTYPIDTAWFSLCSALGIYVFGKPETREPAAVTGYDLSETGNGVRGAFDSLFTTAGQPTNGAWAVKKMGQPVTTTLGTASPQFIKIINENSFRDLSDLKLNWTLLIDGISTQRGVIPLLVAAPRKQTQLMLPIKLPASGSGSEALLDIAYHTKKADGAIPSGHLVAADELVLRPYSADVSVRPAGELSFTDEGAVFNVSAATTDMHIRFNKQSGWLQEYTVAQRTLLDDSLGLGIDFQQEPRLQLFSTSTAADFVVVRADYQLTDLYSALHVHYTINAKGEMQIEQILEVDSTQLPATDTIAKKPSLPRFGMQWHLPVGYDSIAFYGGIPGAVSLRSSPLSSPTTASSSLRWSRIRDSQGHGIQFFADSALFTIEAARQLNGGSHPQTRLNIDLTTSPVPFGNYRYTYKVSPF